MVKTFKHCSLSVFEGWKNMNCYQKVSTVWIPDLSAFLIFYQHTCNKHQNVQMFENKKKDLDS